MPTQQRQLAYTVAGATTVLLVVIGLLYFAGSVIATGADDNRAIVCLGLAVVAGIMANITRPQTQTAP